MGVTLGAPRPTHSNHQTAQSSSGSGWLIAALVVFSMAIWAPGLALLIGFGLGTWSVLTLRKQGRIALSRSRNIHPIAMLAFAVAVGGGSVAKLVGEYKDNQRREQAEIAQKDEAARHAAERAAEEQRIAARQAEHDAALRNGAPTKAAEFNSELDNVQSAMAKEEWISALDALESLAPKAEEMKALEPSPPEFPPVLERYQKLDQQVRPVADAIRSLEQTTKRIAEADESVKGTKDGATWLAAKKTWQEAKSTLESLDASDPSVRGYLPDYLTNLSRDMDARLKRAKRYADPYESKLAEAEALRILCGDPPAGCGGGWDGECIGTKTAFKRVAHDPGSVDVENCSQPVLTKEHCWVSECTVRAKNMFGAKVVSRKREERSKEKVQDGEDCQVKRKDLGDGTFKQVRECQPRYKSKAVMDDRCTFEVMAWKRARTLKAEGKSLEPAPAWPRASLRTGTCEGCEREGARDEKYEVLFTSDGAEHACAMPEAKWRAFTKGQRVEGKVRVVTGGLDCASLR